MRFRRSVDSKKLGRAQNQRGGRKKNVTAGREEFQMYSTVCNLQCVVLVYLIRNINKSVTVVIGRFQRCALISYFDS